MQYSVHQFTLEIITPSLIDFNSLQSHVPGIKYSEHQQSDIKIIFKQSVSTQLTVSHNCVIVEGVWCESFKQDFPHLVYAVLRKIWIEKGFFPVHSICLEDTLIIGHSGTGKTTLALKALDQGFKVHSFDKSIIALGESMTCCAGTDVASLKSGQVLTPEVFPKQNHINKVYLFHISSTPLKVVKLSSESALHQLYPYFLDSVKEDVLLTQDMIYEGVVCSSAKANLQKSLKNWLSTHRVEVLIGQISDILAYVKGLV